MEGSLEALAVVLGVSLSISFLCSILEAVFLSVTHSWVEVLKSRNERAANLLIGFLRQVDEPIAAILTLNTIAHTVGATMGGAIALEVFGDRWIAIFSAVLTLVILVFSEIVPKTLGATYWKGLTVPTTYTLWVLIILLKPILLPLSWLNRLLQPKKKDRLSVSRAEIEVLTEIGRREGILGEHEWQVVSRVMRLGAVTAGDVMTPRTDIVALPLEASISKALDLMLESGHLTAPVYDGTLDTIVGIAGIRDLLANAGKRQGSLDSAMRPAVFAPESKAAEDLIAEMKEERLKMVVVVDEFGGTAGLLTLEDLLEEIVGEIRDEHEPEEPEGIQVLSDGSVAAHGMVLVREVNLKLDPPLPGRGSETVGGLVFGLLGRLPRVDDEVTAGDWAVAVTQVDGRRIEAVEIRRPDSTS
jgi:putative hemolysin